MEAGALRQMGYLPPVLPGPGTWGLDQGTGVPDAGSRCIAPAGTVKPSLCQ